MAALLPQSGSFLPPHRGAVGDRKGRPYADMIRIRQGALRVDPLYCGTVDARSTDAIQSI